VLLILFGFWSLISFQEVYGRLKPHYGGGTLYPLAIAIDPSANLPDDMKAAVARQDGCLLLVDKDDKFVYVLSVNTRDRRLIGLPASAIRGFHILPGEPKHPVDAQAACPVEPPRP
jgi:hypothetical protein